MFLLFLSKFPSILSVQLLFYSPIAASGPRLVSGQGLLGPDSTGETQRIHKENQAKLQGMSQSEILDEQKKLLSQLGSFYFKYLCIMYIINYRFSCAEFSVK